MWSDAARAASVAARGGNVAAQGAATQASFIASARGTNPYAANAGRQRGGGGGGQQTGNAARPQTGGTASAHGAGIDSVARSMGGNGSQQDTRADKTRIDQLVASSAPISSYQTDRANGTLDNIQARQSNATMVGEHTTPPALQKYLD